MAFAIMMFPAGRLQDRRGPRLVVLVGALLGGVGYVLSAHAPGAYGSFRVAQGTGIALGYAGVVAGGIRWFPDLRGTATGIMMGGFGPGALVFAAWGVARLLGPFLAGRVYDMVGSCVPSFWLLALLCLFANAIILLRVKPVLRRRVAASRP